MGHSMWGVKAALNMRSMFHLPKDEEQKKRFIRGALLKALTLGPTGGMVPIS